MPTGYYFSVQRNNEYMNLDLSEMTESEIRDILNTKSRDFVITLLIGVLGKLQPTPQESQFELAK